MPDCAVFASPSLHYLVASAFQSLKRSERVHKTGTATRRSSFRYQATPVDSPPDTPGFEFASSVWEDKKPDQKDVRPCSAECLFQAMADRRAD